MATRIQLTNTGLNMENEIEQMRIRLAEMAAEVERLNAVIDAANAHDPIYQYSNTHDLSLWTDCNKWTFDIMRDDHRRIVYASQIPAQKSPAVAVPENWRIVKKKTCYALICGNDVIATLAGPESEENAEIIDKLLSSQRITEKSPVANSKTENTTNQPRITDPDSTNEFIDNIPTLGDADRVVGATDFTDYIDGLQK